MTRFTSPMTSGPIPSPGRRSRLWVAIHYTSQKRRWRIAKASLRTWHPVMQGEGAPGHANRMAQGKINSGLTGAGFRGLEAAKALRRAPAEVVVIDRHNHHCFQPLLYQVATAALSPADIAWPIRHILRPQRNATVFMENVLGIDAEARLVRAEFGEVPYDYLVIAGGCQHSLFGPRRWV